MNITIVTAFFDIGRGDIPNEMHGRPIPEYQKRSVDKYFEYFNNLAKLKNDMIIYTTNDFKQRILDARSYYGNLENTKVISLDSYMIEPWHDEKNKIASIMNSSKFIDNVSNPHFIEYWSPDYILVNLFKSAYVSNAIESKLVKDNLVAWIDFGYCRDSEEDLNFNWSYDFDPQKVHMFFMKDIEHDRPITEIIYTGDVYIQGCHIVAGKSIWNQFKTTMLDSFRCLLDQNLCDDDQTVLLMSYLKNPDLFYLRYNSSTDWFRIFKDYRIQGGIL